MIGGLNDIIALQCIHAVFNLLIYIYILSEDLDLEKLQISVSSLYNMKAENFVMNVSQYVRDSIGLTRLEGIM